MSNRFLLLPGGVCFRAEKGRRALRDDGGGLQKKTLEKDLTFLKKMLKK
jgi:hypothetical protein